MMFWEHTHRKLYAALFEAVNEAHANGSRVAGKADERGAIARIALDRIHSFSGRGVDIGDCARAVTDIAQGVSAHFVENNELEGPLFQEYRRLAEKLFKAYMNATK